MTIIKVEKEVPKEWLLNDVKHRKHFGVRYIGITQILVFICVIAIIIPDVILISEE